MKNKILIVISVGVVGVIFIAFYWFYILDGKLGEKTETTEQYKDRMREEANAFTSKILYSTPKWNRLMLLAQELTN